MPRARHLILVIACAAGIGFGAGAPARADEPGSGSCHGFTLKSPTDEVLTLQRNGVSCVEAEQVAHAYIHHLDIPHRFRCQSRAGNYRSEADARVRCEKDTGTAILQVLFDVKWL